MIAGRQFSIGSYILHICCTQTLNIFVSGYRFKMYNKQTWEAKKCLSSEQRAYLFAVQNNKDNDPSRPKFGQT